MKTLLHEYAAYDRWANSRFLERLSEESEHILDAPAPSSFPTLRETVLHIRDAECAWTHRLLGTPVRWPAEPGKAISTIMPHCERLHELVLGLDEAGFESERTYRDLKGNEHRSPAWRMLMHCFNHSTQHRGQLITQMRFLGLDRIPANDLVIYQRSVDAR